MAKIRLLFDECLGEPVAAELGRLLAFGPDTPEIAHVLEFQKQGIPDQEWIPRLAAEGWIVVTADRGRGNKGGKLPIICRREGVTHIMLSARIHQRNSLAKAAAIIDVWPAILRLASAPRGSGFLLKVGPKGHAALVEVQPPQPRSS